MATCNLGMGCEQAGVCYAEAMNQPEKCGNDTRIVLAGTGHRPDKLAGHGPEAVAVLRESIDKAMREFVKKHGRPHYIISGMALGFDQALAEWAVANRIPFIAAIPFAGQEKAWPLDVQKRYIELRKKAARCIFIKSGPYHPQYMQDRNEWMVNHATHILALHNGSGGGTANCLRYAKTKIAKDRIFNFWNIWHHLALERL